MALRTIGMLWMEGPLSYLEQLCIKSFVDAGHPVILYHYGAVQNVPGGVEMADAGAILPRDDFLVHKRTGSPALHSDVFRYRMLARGEGMIWADTDAYCLRPFETGTGHFYGWESDKHVNGGVLGLPPDSATLAALLDFTADEFSIPSYYGEEYARELTEAKAAGTPVHASEQPWGVWGPHAITHFLHETGEVAHAFPREVLYPFTFKDRRDMLKRDFDTTGIVTERTRSIHFYGRRMRKRLVEREGGVPKPRSLIGKLLRQHGIDPAGAPLPGPKPAEPSASVGDDLTAIADRLGLDRGSGKHRFTELYHMLLAPIRGEAFDLLEIGPFGGAAEGLRMWAEYLPRARLHGLDVTGDGAVQADRVTLRPWDGMSDLGAVSADLPPLRVIVDDGSHASHHQQAALLSLWPRLSPGGLYVIEDLRGQPAEQEQPEITKTGDLLYGFQMSRAFEHADPEIHARFAAIAPEISGCFVFQAGYDRKKRHQVAVIHKR